MGYPAKLQLIARKHGGQWLVNFPNALALALQFRKGEVIEWEIESREVLRMIRIEPREEGSGGPGAVTHEEEPVTESRKE